jgi:hypothetical protein
MTVFWVVYSAVWYKLTDISEVLAVSTIRAIVMAANTCETSANYQTAPCNIPEDGHLQIFNGWKVSPQYKNN